MAELDNYTKKGTQVDVRWDPDSQKVNLYLVTDTLVINMALTSNGVVEQATAKRYWDKDEPLKQQFEAQVEEGATAKNALKAVQKICGDHGILAVTHTLLGKISDAPKIDL